MYRIYIWSHFFSDITFRISFRISERLYGYVMTLRRTAQTRGWFNTGPCPNALSIPIQHVSGTTRNTNCLRNGWRTGLNTSSELGSYPYYHGFLYAGRSLKQTLNPYLRISIVSSALSSPASKTSDVEIGVKSALAAAPNNGIVNTSARDKVITSVDIEYFSRKSKGMKLSIGFDHTAVYGIPYSLYRHWRVTYM